MSWLFGSGKASDEETVRARQRIEELHRFYQSKLVSLQAELESQKQDHVEDMAAKEATLAELVRQKKESDDCTAQLQDKLLHLAQELAYTNLQLQHREQEVLRSARAMVVHDFGDSGDSIGGASRASRTEGKSRLCAANNAQAAPQRQQLKDGGAHEAALGESQARMRVVAEERHQQALVALENQYKGVLEDQKRRHHRALVDAAAEREEALLAAEKKHREHVADIQQHHEATLRAYHSRLIAAGGIANQALSTLTQTTASESVPSDSHRPQATNESGASSDGSSSVLQEPASMQQLIEKLQAGRDGIVQKLIVRQIVLSLVKSTSRAHTLEVLGLAAKVLDFSPFERLDAGLPESVHKSGAGTRGGRGLLTTIFGFGGGSANSEEGASTPGGDDPQATSVSIAAVKALVLAYVNEEDQGEQHALLNELSRMLRFSHDERQSCNILRESQHLSPSDTVGEGPGWWFGGNGDRIVSISAESGAHGKEDPNNFSTAAAATSPSLEEEWLRFLQFRRWGRFGSVDFNLAWELKRLRQLGGGGKKGTAVQDTVRYEKRLLATLKRHKESLSAQQFNAHCKQWIASAQRLGVLPPVRGMGEDANMSQARDVAQFFRTIPGLDKRAIGEWLSEPADRNPFNDLVLRAFTRSFDFAQPGFTGKFCDALRDFLASFRLPGEAQKIDRLMEAFARELFRAGTDGTASASPGGHPSNKIAGVFASADAVYVLAFSTVMLNTDLHSPTMEDSRRMTLEAFISNNRGINDEQDLPRDFLTDLYEDIKKTEIKKDCDPFTS